MSSSSARRSAADRAARYRRRQHPHRHEVVVSVPVCDAIVDLLITTEWLPVAKWQDRRQIGLAIAAMLKAAAKSRHA